MIHIIQQRDRDNQKYYIDFFPTYLSEMQDTISTAVLQNVSTGITVDTLTKDDKKVYFWVSGGAVDGEYSFDIKITTAGGLEKVESFQVMIT